MKAPQPASICVIAIGAAAAIVFAEPTQLSIAIGVPVAVAGGLVWFAAAGVEGEGAEPHWGGFYAHVRHPRLLAALLMCAGVLLVCGSQGRYGRWVPRAVAPLAILYFFAGALPRADAALRERVRREGGGSEEEYLSSVPALAPALRRFTGAPRARWRWPRIVYFNNWFWPAAAAAIIYLSMFRMRWPESWRL